MKKRAHKLKERTAAFVLAVLVLLACDIYRDITVLAVDDIPYIDADGRERLADNVTVRTGSQISNDSTLGTGGPGEEWYLWNGNGGQISRLGRITVSGNVHLILADGLNVIISGGINVPAGSRLTIYAQTKSNSAMGGLSTILSGSMYAGFAGIGGNDDENGGIITINGGNITARGGLYAAAIGGGRDANNGEVTINGGIVTAHGSSRAAGIGGSENGNGGTVFINGGIVTVTAGNQADPDNSAPRAIGHGEGGTSGTVSVSGRYHYWVNTAPNDNSSTALTAGNFSNNSTVFAMARDYGFIKLIATPAEIDVTVNKPPNISYGETLRNPTASINTNGINGIGSYSFIYSYTGTVYDGEINSGNNSVYGPSEEKPVLPGEYFVTARLVHETYSGSSTSEAFYIGLRTLTWTRGTVADKVYDGNTNAIITNHPSLNGIINNDNVTLAAGYATFDSPDVSDSVGVTAHDYRINGTSLWKYEVPTGQPPFANAAITGASTPTPPPTEPPETPTPPGTPTPPETPTPPDGETPTPEPPDEETPAPPPEPGPQPSPAASPSPTPSASPVPSPTPSPDPTPTPTPEVVIPTPLIPTPYPTPFPWAGAPTPTPSPGPENPTLPYASPIPDQPPIDVDGLPGIGDRGDVEFITVDEFFDGEHGLINGSSMAREQDRRLGLIMLGGIAAAMFILPILILIIARKKKKKKKKEV